MAGKSAIENEKTTNYNIENGKTESSICPRTMQTDRLYKWWDNRQQTLLKNMKSKNRTIQDMKSGYLTSYTSGNRLYNWRIEPSRIQLISEQYDSILQHNT